MSNSIISGIGRFATGTIIDISGAIRRERNYSKGIPQSALLFLTYRCTSRCRTCRMWSRPWNQKSELSLDQWEKATDTLISHGVRSIELFGGDVLLRKDVLFPLINHLKENNATLHIPTNCNLLDQETALRLIDSGADHLYLSVDGVGEDHDDVRGVGNTFRKVETAIGALSEYRKAESNVKLICNTTVSKYNVESLDKIAHFAADAGFDEIHFEYVGEMPEEVIPKSTVNGLEPTPYFLRGEDSSLISDDQVIVLREELKSIRETFRAQSFGVRTINIDLLSNQHMVEGTVPGGKCYASMCEVTIDPGGNIIACPFFQSFRYGNILEDSFEDLWWGEQHRFFHEYREEKRLAMCRYCIISVQRNHSFLTRLRRIYLTRLRRVRKKLARRSA